MEGVRLRLQFEDRCILSRSQRKEGLKRSWIVLKPHHGTVSDLAYHILRAFELQESCPHGLLLSMDGFVLPSFESTSILKDRDVVWVKKKERSSSGAATLCGGKNSVKASKIGDKQPVSTKLQLLAKDEFIKETGGYESESKEDEDKDEPPANANYVENVANENADSKKRKASKKLKSPKRKKSKLANAEESPTVCGNARNEEPAAKKKSLQDDKVSLKGSQLEKVKSSCSKGKGNMSSTSRNYREVTGNGETAEKPKASISPAVCGDDGNKELAAKAKSSQDNVLKDSQLENEKSSDIKGQTNIASTSKNDREVLVLSQSPPQEKGEGSVGASSLPSEAKKLPSRNARRKKLKRAWLREMRKIGKTVDGQRRHSSGDVDWRKKFLYNNDQTLVSQDDHGKSEVYVQRHQSHTVVAATGNQQHHHYKGSNDVNVPVEIRPGYIRFEPLDEDADRPVQKSPVPVTSFQWNGVTNKKKGQKWGKEKVAIKCANNSYQKSKWADKGHQKTKWTDSDDQKTTRIDSDYQNTACADSNFQRGAWDGSHNLNQAPSQEASQGKETQPCDSMDFVKLLPYGPVPLEGDIVAYRVIELSSSWTPEVSPFRVGKISSCNEGSKKIRLAPVPEHPLDLETTDRTLYGEDGSLEVDFTSLIDVRALKLNRLESSVPVGGKAGVDSNAQENNRNEVNQAPAQENGEANVWEEIAQALSAKKEQLSQEDRWRRKASSAKVPPPTYRGLRGTALGPIMALLRAHNAIL